MWQGGGEWGWEGLLGDMDAGPIPTDSDLEECTDGLRPIIREAFLKSDVFLI